jgi:uncharacterized protein YjiS (DUF1127 family)
VNIAASHDTVSMMRHQNGDKVMLTKVAKALNRYSAYRRTTNELARLTDRELGDLGIARCDINRVARAGVNANF